MYWNTRDDAPIHYPIQRAMGLKRWEQIYQYLHVWEPSSPSSLLSLPSSRRGRGAKKKEETVHLDEKVETIAAILRQNFKQFWRVGTHVAVDECI
jgi:hypothetical protein